MSTWKENKGLFWKGLGALAALGLVWGASVLAWGSRRREIEKENERYLQELRERAKGNTPAKEAVKVLNGRMAELKMLRGRLGSAAFTLEGRYLEAKTRLEFDELSKQLRDSIAKHGPVFPAAKAPLGFGEKLLKAEEEEVERLVRRLSAVRRFIEAARGAKVASVRKIKHASFVQRGEEGLEFHRTVVPFQCVFDADERSLTALLHDIMTFPRKALIPSRLAIQVEERTRGTFRVDAELCAVFIDKGAVKAEELAPFSKAKISPVRY